MQSERRLYFDNSATSFPKPPGVAEAMRRYAVDLGASPGRGAYREVREAGARLDEARALVCELIGGQSPERVVFTLNCSDALNLGIRGVLEPALRDGPTHVVTTWMDHNSVLRPLNALASRWAGRLTQTRVEADAETGLVDPAAIRAAIRGETRLVCVAHASNVSGTLQPIGEIGAICRSAGVPLLVDGAQSVGHVPIDLGSAPIDLLAFPGHKGLLGPLGTGGLYLAEGMEAVVETVREGGTGSVSERDTQPDTLPEKYEPGSHNAIGLIGLAEGVRWLLDRGVERVWAHERGLMDAFLAGLTDGSGEAPRGLRLLGPAGTADRVGVFSVTLEGVTPAALAGELEERFGVLTRSGLHCAPLAHRTFGTSPEQVASPEMAGSTRLSLGAFLTEADVAVATDALRRIAAERVEAATVA